MKINETHHSEKGFVLWGGVGGGGGGGGHCHNILGDRLKRGYY